MDEVEASRYWCHMCSQEVNPILEVQSIKCPICQSGFVEEMTSASAQVNENPFDLGGSDSDRALSLWAPILLGMMSHPRRRLRSRRQESEEDDEEDSNEASNQNHDGGIELDRELESIIRRRRRSSAAILHLLQSIRAGMSPESENSENERRDRESRERDRVILINPFNQTIIVQGSYDSNSQTPPMGSLGDYFIGPGLDLLLQHLAENDPNRYGTPPAQKEAVESMPTVNVEETLQCAVCLEDVEIGSKAREMPCKHKFHGGCILPWLELHSSCPVCRYQLPADESKLDSDSARNNSSIQTHLEVGDTNSTQTSNIEGGEGDRNNGNGRRFSVTLPWPLSSLFSSSNSASQSSNANSSSATSSPGSSSEAPQGGSHAHED